MYKRHIHVQLPPILYFPHDFAIMSSLNPGGPDCCARDITIQKLKKDEYARVGNTGVLETIHVRGLKRHNITMTNLHHAVDTEVILLKTNGKLYKTKMPNSIHATLFDQLEKKS